MANTVINSGNVVKHYTTELRLQQAHDSYVQDYIGSTEQDLIQEITNFPGVGEKIVLPLMKSIPVSGNVKKDNAALEGNETAMVMSNTDITMIGRKAAVRLDGSLEESKTAIPLRATAKRQLGDLAARIQDYEFFSQVNPDADNSSHAQDPVAEQTGNTLLTDAANWATGATYENWNVVVAGSATDFTDLGSSDTMSVALIGKAKLKAKMRGIRPMQISLKKGYKALYVLNISPEQEDDLINDDTYRENNLYAELRGIDNPLINGAIALVGGVLIRVVTNQIDGGNGATLLEYKDYTTHWAQCAMLLGAQAAGVAYTRRPTWYERMFEYGEEYGIATKMILGFAKSIINLGTTAVPVNRDYGTVYVLSSASKAA